MNSYKSELKIIIEMKCEISIFKRNLILLQLFHKKQTQIPNVYLKYAAIISPKPLWSLPKYIICTYSAINVWSIPLLVVNFHTHITNPTNIIIKQKSNTHLCILCGVTPHTCTPIPTDYFYNGRQFCKGTSKFG